MKYYVMSELSKSGYRKGYDIWYIARYRYLEIIEQCLAHQVIVIRINEGFLKVEMEEIKRNIEIEKSSNIDIDQPVRDADGDRGI